MGEIKKRIALLMGQADESYQRRFIDGFTRKAMENQTDTVIFSMYRKYQDTEERERAEGNVFSLVNYSLFDGIVLLKDTIQTTDLAQKLEEQIHDAFRGPVLVIERESNYFTSAYSDGYGGMCELVSHFIERHQFTDIAFLAGKKWHRHSMSRVQAYRDMMEKHGL